MFNDPLLELERAIESTSRQYLSSILLLYIAWRTGKRSESSSLGRAGISDSSLGDSIWCPERGKRKRSSKSPGPLPRFKTGIRLALGDPASDRAATRSDMDELCTSLVLGPARFLNVRRFLSDPNGSGLRLSPAVALMPISAQIPTYRPAILPDSPIAGSGSDLPLGHVLGCGSQGGREEEKEING